MSAGTEDKDVPQGQEPFFDRWSRRKAEAKQEARPPAREQDAAAKSPPPDLPPVEKLTFESDYRAFFHPKVGEDTRRAALKKLFSNPHFNVMDGLDVYIDDYSKTEPIPAAMLASLKQAQNILQWAKEDHEKRAQDRLQRDASGHALEPPASQANPPSGIQASGSQAAPGSPVVLDERESPPAPAPAPAERIAGNNIPSASEPPQRGPKS